MCRECDSQSNLKKCESCDLWACSKHRIDNGKGLICCHACRDDETMTPLKLEELVQLFPEAVTRHIDSIKADPGLHRPNECALCQFLARKTDE
jgi:hypothetical protein